MTTTLLLVRHGRTAWNKDERFRGRADLPLDEVGLWQAEALADRISHEFRPAAVYSGPLQRAQQTAQAIARPFSLTVEVDNHLIDLDYGDFSGLSPEEAEARFPDLYREWFSVPHIVRFPQGESLEDVRARATHLVESVAARYPDDQVVLITHSAVCRVFICALLSVHNGYYWKFRVDPASLTVFKWSHGAVVMELANDTCHLRTLRE